MPAIPSWLLEPLWDQFAALLPDRPVYDPSHPLGCHKPRIADRIIFEKLIQVLRFGCSYESIADCTCGATTIRERRDEWIRAGIFAKLKTIARESYDRIVGLVLEELAVDGCITKAPGGGECAGRSPVDRGKLGMKRSLLVEGTASRSAGCWPRRTGTTPRCWPPRWTNSTTSARCPTTSPSTSTPATTRRRPATSSHARGMTGEIAHKGDKAPIQAGQRWHVERTNAWHNTFNRLQRCYERNEDVIDAFFDLADAIITVRRLIREAWTLYRWDTPPGHRP